MDELEQRIAAKDAWTFKECLGLAVEFSVKTREVALNSQRRRTLAPGRSEFIDQTRNRYQPPGRHRLRTSDRDEASSAGLATLRPALTHGRQNTCAHYAGLPQGQGLV